VCTICAFFSCAKLGIFYWFYRELVSFLGLFEMRSDQLRSHWLQLF